MDFAEATNWVDQQGGLPSYIKRIEKHLERKGMSKSHAIATAVNVVKKMCATGDLNYGGIQQANAGSRAEACAAVARWNQMKAAAGESARTQMEGLEGIPLTETLGAEGSPTPAKDGLADLAESFTSTVGFGEAVRSLSGSRMRIRAISPGWGSSGYYSEEMLQEAARKGLFQEGTQLFLDHPTMEQNEARPERSIRDLAAVFESPGRWEGDGVYADVKVFPPFREALAAMKDHIGVSIRARGFAETGEAEGRQGTIITELSELQSVDFVTRAGRGGQITALLESAQADVSTTGGPVSGTEPQGSPAAGTPTINPAVPTPQQVFGNTTPPAPVQEAAKDPRVELLEKQLAEARAAAEVKTAAGKALAESDRQLAEAKQEIFRLRASETARHETAKKLAESGLPEVAHARVTATVIGFEGKGLPLQESGDVDTAKLAVSIDAAIEAEKAYVGSVLEHAGVGSIRGLGGGNEGNTMTPEKFSEALTGAFAGIGLDEKTAALAAKGR